MCELLAMNSRLPATVNFSLRELSRHGGETGPHRDGWGIAYVMGRDFRIIKEPAAAAESDCVCYIHAQHCVSHIVISHIRRASLPKEPAFENTLKAKNISPLEQSMPKSWEMTGRLLCSTWGHYSGPCPDQRSRSPPRWRDADTDRAKKRQRCRCKLDRLLSQRLNDCCLITGVGGKNE